MVQYELVSGKGSVAIGLNQHTPESVAEGGGYFEADPAEVAGLLAAGVIREHGATAKESPRPRRPISPPSAEVIAE